MSLERACEERQSNISISISIWISVSAGFFWCCTESRLLPTVGSIVQTVPSSTQYLDLDLGRVFVLCSALGFRNWFVPFVPSPAKSLSHAAPGSRGSNSYCSSISSSININNSSNQQYYTVLCGAGHSKGPVQVLRVLQLVRHCSCPVLFLFFLYEKVPWQRATSVFTKYHLLSRSVAAPKLPPYQALLQCGSSTNNVPATANSLLFLFFIWPSASIFCSSPSAPAIPPRRPGGQRRSSGVCRAYLHAHANRFRRRAQLPLQQHQQPPE